MIPLSLLVIIPNFSAKVIKLYFYYLHILKCVIVWYQLHKIGFNITTCNFRTTSIDKPYHPNINIKETI